MSETFWMKDSSYSLYWSAKSRYLSISMSSAALRCYISNVKDGTITGCVYFLISLLILQKSANKSKSPLSSISCKRMSPSKLMSSSRSSYIESKSLSRSTTYDCKCFIYSFANVSRCEGSVVKSELFLSFYRIGFFWFNSCARLFTVATVLYDFETDSLVVSLRWLSKVWAACYWRYSSRFYSRSSISCSMS